MAGTRRQSRARETTNTQQYRRSVPRVASIVPDTAISTNANVIEIAESVDGGSPRQGSSPHPETPVSCSTTAFCKKCNRTVGEFYNAWDRLASGYWSPALLGSYRSLLRRPNNEKEASDKTELAGCTIVYTRCPGCDERLGYIVVDAPAELHHLSDRQFLKLQDIELRCEISSNKTIAVEPREVSALELAFEGSTSPSPGPNDTATDTMELDTPLSSSHPLWTQPAHSKDQQSHQLPQPMEPSGQPRQLYGPQEPAPISRSHTSQTGAPPVTASTPILPSISPQPAQLAQPHPGSAIGGSIKNVRTESVGQGQRDGYSYPHEPREVYFDAIERLQTQTAQNTSALAAQARNQTDYTEIVRQTEGNLRHEFQTQLHRQDQELRRMDEVVGRLLQELQDCRRTIVGLVQEVNVTRAESTRRPSEVAQPGYQDEALELMARRIGEVSHRTTDLEILRDHVAIIGGRVQRLESESAAAHNPHARPPLPTYQPTHPAHVTHAVPSHPNHVISYQAPPQPTSNPQPIPHHENPVAPVPPESAQRHETVPNQNGWATVNAGVKRVHESGTNSPHQGAGSTPGSPKRPRLITGESQESSVTQIPPGPQHILASQAQDPATSQTPMQPGPHPMSHHGPHPSIHHESASSQAYPAFITPDGPSDQSWRAESHRVVERRVRGRGSRGGRGPGSRGGRVRKSMQGQQHNAGTPDWERDSWSAVPDSQGSPIVIDEHTPVRSIMRRGGGGGGPRGGSSMMERANEWTPEVGPRSVFHDQPSETKKTRSKPIRNEEGILVRKDGRPDRRSQSSAANLRKVHARKEEQQREGEAGSTPNGLHFSMSAGTDTPSPTPRGHSEQDVTDSVRKKHKDILGRIFPDGIDTSRKQNDYAHQVFNEDRDHTAKPRAQTNRTAKPVPHIKKEHVERNEMAGADTRTNGDVNMDNAGSSADNHTQDNPPTSIGRPLENSEHGSYHNQHQASSEQGSRVQVPETQATDASSATLTTESVEAR